MPALCYVCGGQQWQPRVGSLRDDPETGVVECQGCGVVVAAAAPGVTVNYEEGSMHGESQLVLADWRASSRSDDLRRAGHVTRHLRQAEIVVDVGCGAGGLLSELDRRGVEALGVEPDTQTREGLLAEGLKVWSESADIPRALRENVGIVTLFHVLEHVHDARQLLRDLIELFPATRVYFVEVPCSEDPLLTLYRSEAFSNFTYWSHHEYLHSRTSLVILLSSVFASVNVQRVQRYGLGNHLGWLANGSPGGHESMPWLTETDVDHGYRSGLIAQGYSDTLWAECTMNWY